MTRPSSSATGETSPRELLVHSSWLRRLARSLVRDEATAEDLVQDAFGIAVEQRSTVRDLRSFLAGTVRNLARRNVRGATRRRRRERDHARDESVPDVSVLAERTDLLRIVLEELRSLPEVQQRTLTLRYMEGIDTSRIAALEGSSPSTVRSNLARGLARLRERLDERSGSRGTWCSVLAPFAGAPYGAPIGEGSIAPDAASPALSAGSVGVLATSGAMKLASFIAASIVLVLAGSWLLVDRAALIDEAPVTQIPAEPVSLVHDPRPALSDESAPRTAASTPQAGDDPAALGSIPAGAVVDTHTAEPVPHLEFRLNDGESEQLFTTDASGDFAGTAPMLHGELQVQDAGGIPGLLLSWRKRAVPFPFDAPIEMEVGPTFTLALDVPVGLQLEELRARLEPDERTRRLGFSIGAAALRPGDLPWVRFPFSPELPTLEGPLFLTVSDGAGYWFGRAQVDRALGIEPHPVQLDLCATGALEFEVSGMDSRQTMHKTVLVHCAETGRSWQRLIRSATSEGQAPDGRRLAHIEPGRYTWSLETGESGLGGEVEVAADETRIVTLDLTPVGPTFDAVVHIHDSTNELELGDAWVWVSDPDDPDTAFNGEVVRSEADGAGAWRIELVDLPARPWRVAMGQPGASARFEPRVVGVAPGIAPETVEAIDLGKPLPVDVAVRSAHDGTDLPLAEISYWVDGGSGATGARQTDGSRRIRIPRNASTRVFAWAPGYRMASVSHTPVVDGASIEFALTRGWSNCVRVWNDTTGGRLQGAEVLVDGELVGKTDSEGTYWVERDERPKSLSVRAAGFRRVLRSGRNADEMPRDSVFGFNFVLREE